MKKQFIAFRQTTAPKIVSRRMGVKPFVTAAYKSDGDGKGSDDDVEIKNAGDLLKQLNEMKTALETKAQGDIDAKFEQKMAEINEKIEEVKNLKPEVTAVELKAIKDDLDLTMKAFEKFASKAGATRLQPSETKSFNEVIADVIKEHAEEIKSFKKGASEKRFELKTVGDMSIAANFADAATTITRDVRTSLIEKPYNRVWLGDLLPQGTSRGASILYPKENGGEGGAALWTDKTADKAQMDFDFTGQSAYMKWIAGIVIIEREMLDDIDFLTSYIQNKMLISLKIAENDFILNGSTDTNPVDGLLDVATAYNGSFTSAVDRIIDAGWGQIVEDTFDFYNPTTTILTPRDAVAVGLNKADGSGEYNLPNGSVAYANGQLTVGGIDVVRSTQVGTGNFVTFDKNATMFVKRMQPELRMFEDAALAKKNKIMFRVEERATLAIFNNAAIVKGTLTTS